MAERIVSERPTGSTHLFTVRDEIAESEVEAVLVATENGPRAWLNYCRHRGARLDTGEGALRDGSIRCPRHGAVFDPESGDCESGPCAGKPLHGLDVERREDGVYLTASGYSFVGEGGI